MVEARPLPIGFLRTGAAVSKLGGAVNGVFAAKSACFFASRDACSLFEIAYAADTPPMIADVTAIYEIKPLGVDMIHTDVALLREDAGQLRVNGLDVVIDTLYPLTRQLAVAPPHESVPGNATNAGVQVQNVLCRLDGTTVVRVRAHEKQCIADQRSFAVSLAARAEKPDDTG